MGISVLGGGGHGAVVVETARAAGLAVDGFHDDDPARGLLDLRNLGPVDRAWGLTSAIALGVGSASLRRLWLERAQSVGLLAPPIVHPSAWVSPSAHLEAGCVVMAGAVVQARAQIGAGAIINTGASVDHDCRVGACVHIAPGARLAGAVQVCAGAFIGMMAAVIEGRRIGVEALVAAGAVVVCDVADGQRVAGVPARAMLQRA